MADAGSNPEGGTVHVSSDITIATAEDIQNQENENNENSLVEIEGSKMEVDGVAGGDGGEAVAVLEAVDAENITKGENLDSIAEDIIQNTEEPPTAETVPSAEDKGKLDEDDVIFEIEVIAVKGEGSADDAVTKEESVETLVIPATTPLAENASTTKINSTQISSDDTSVKNEMEEEGDSYMVLEEADGDDNESETSDDEELTENEQLRKANFKLSERLALLEEFIEVEFSDKFGKFMKKRSHLVDVMGFGGKNEDLKSNGKRSSKSLELVGLLKIVNEQARSNGISRSPRSYTNPRDHSNRGNSSPQKKPSTSSATTSSKEKPKADTAKISATIEADAKPRRCHRCRATGHLVRECPLPIDPRDRRIILRKDSRKEKKERDRLEGLQNPQIKAMRDKRRRLTRAINRQRIK